MKRVLILTNGPLARNPRVFKEASALGAAGHEVTVLGVRNHAPSVALDARLADGAPFRHQPLDMLGPGPGVFLRRLRLKLARDLAHRVGFTSIESLGPAASLLRLARRHPADLIIVHNEIAHWAGVRLLDEGRLVAADIEDWHSEDLLPASRAGRPLRQLRQIERALLNRAAYCTTTSENLSRALHERHGGAPAAVIANAFPLGPSATERPAHTPPRLLWFSQTIGPGRGLESFIDAWARCRAAGTLRLVGEDYGDFSRVLRERLPAERRASLLFSPLIPPGELPALIAEHDVGLALEPREPANKDLTISNKILQYLNAGLAVVATPTAGQREVLAHTPEAGLLHDFADPEDAARQLDTLLADPAALARRQAAARRLAESRYCWEQEAPRLVRLVARALGQA